MPSARRTKVILLAVALLSTVALYYHFSPLQSRQSSYLTTLKLLSASEQREAAAANEKMAAGLKAAADSAKAAAQQKAGPKPDSPRQVEEVMRDRLPAAVDKTKDRATVPNKVDASDSDSHRDKEMHVGEEIMIGGYNAKEEIADILKRKTIVIFSKSYCKYSKKAKYVLLEKYKINPPPYVIELDEHPHGVELQKALGKATGRTTVPNVLIGGVSIGGGDDVAQLDMDGELVETIRKHGKGRIMQIFVEKSD